MDREQFVVLANDYNVIPVHVTLQLDRETPVSIYQRYCGGDAMFLLESAALGETTGRYSFIGLKRRWRLYTDKGATRLVGTNIDFEPAENPLDVLRRLLARYVTYQPMDLPDFFGGAVGFVTYDYVRRLEHLERDLGEDPWPDADFSFAGVVLICDHLRHSTTIVINTLVEVGDDPGRIYDEAAAVLEQFSVDLLIPAIPSEVETERLVATAPSMRERVNIRTIAEGLSNFTRDEYCDVVTRAQRYIHSGDIFQVVPSQQFQRPTSVDPLTLYRVLRSLNPSPYMYLLDSGDHQIVGASPEMLVRVHDGVVSSRPIAGTRPRGLNEQEDLELEREVLHDVKEIAEHVMLVDLGRNDIGRVAEPGSVRVERLAHVERFSHLMHLVSQVDGTLAKGLDAFDAFDALFPAGTLTGAPKVRAMQLIDEFEPVARGPYGGAVGYFSLSGDADFAITIRTLSIRHGVATVQAGGGVVADSKPEFEYQECISKASAPLLALQIADPH